MNDPIATALAEDIGSGDVTCEYFVDAAQKGHARIIAKEHAVVAGSETAAEVFQRVDPATAVRIIRPSGSSVSPGDVVLEIDGLVKSLLTAERAALNFIQRLSGVATLTRKFVDAVAGTPVKILDTRKTTPGLRMLEKAAVASGGGQSYRFGLYDMVMVKDNHLAAKDDLAFLQRQIDKLHTARPEVRIELEADTVEQVRGFLTLRGVHVILLDNMTNDALRECVALRESAASGKGSVQFEASGGVNLDTVAGIAATGVDFISVGGITHSARAIDFSLELEKK